MQAFIVKPSNQQTIVGQMVKFECHVEGIPKPRILWRVRRHNRKGFVRVDSLDQRRFRLMPNGTLVIFNVHFTDQGLYACIAKSPGKKNNATAYLTVFGEFAILFLGPYQFYITLINCLYIFSHEDGCRILISCCN